MSPIGQNPLKDSNCNTVPEINEKKMSTERKKKEKRTIDLPIYRPVSILYGIIPFWSEEKHTPRQQKQDLKWYLTPSIRFLAFLQSRTSLSF
jgi:hypothetical protein